MRTRLGDKLRQQREKLKMTLRGVEQQTGIHNAHLSQIESGTIKRPDPNILWSLSSLYELDFNQLMRLAGHATPNRGAAKGMLGVAFRALGELTPDEQGDALRFIDELRQSRKQATE